MIYTFFSKTSDNSKYIEVYQDIKSACFYSEHGRNYIKLYKKDSTMNYDYCIDLSCIDTYVVTD